MYRSLPRLLVLLLPLALPLVAVPAQAITVCGDGVCQTWAFPPESPENCQADCGFCGDAICGYPETCSNCVNDCGNSCLNYTLSSPLKKSDCAGDDDGDCLDNAKETDLAWVVAPWYFYDEDENCSDAWYTQGPVSSLHFGRRDFVQVRPAGSRVDLWQAGGTPKTVWVTFFLLHPHDCQSHSIFNIGGHQGDSEHVRFQLKSVDLQKWVITLGEYHHHGRVHNFSGSYLKARAREIGTSYVSVAGDEDGHGSWPGKAGGSSHCAGSEDDFCYSRCDCFRGSMGGAFANGYYDLVSASRNIGGPAPERWRTSVVSTFGGGAYNWFDVGHGQVREYWTPVSGAWKKFCGWECSTRFVDSGDCYYSIHGETGCSSALSEKVDTRSFSNALASSATVVASSRAGGGETSADLDRLRREVADSLYVVWRLPVAEVSSWQERIGVSADPIAVLVPALAGRTPAEQVGTLRWMLETAPEKVASALADGLLDPGRLSLQERTVLAQDLLDRLARLLESRGYAQPSPVGPHGYR